MTTSSDHSTHPIRRRLVIFLSVVAILGVFLAICLVDDEDRWKSMRVLFEAGNGATWSTECQTAALCKPRLLFALAVAFRTALNSAVAVAFVAGVLFALSAPWRNLMNAITLEHRIRLMEGNLLDSILGLIESRYPNVAADENLQREIKEQRDKAWEQIPAELRKPRKPE